MQSPKLEVVASVADATPVVVAAPVSKLTVASDASSVADGARVQVDGAFAAPQSATGSSLHSGVSVKESGEASIAVVSGSRLVRLLEAGGISKQVLARLQDYGAWPAIDSMPLSRALPEVAGLLRAEYRAIPKRPLGERVAFVGAAGAGKTTALCKRLAMDVFLRGERPAALKLDLDRANPGDALSVFCEALGAAYIRTPADAPSPGRGRTLYIDLPGFALWSEDELAEIRAALNPLFTTSRAIVINAAYDPALMRRCFEVGARLACTHVVFTHVDELQHWGKLWDFLLRSGLTPLFLSTGQNIAGDCEENVFDAVLSRTFAGVGLENASEVASA
ncbi:MAG: hypothetical protein WCO60_12370 [Verrucomicrobiota bacterium]